MTLRQKTIAILTLIGSLLVLVAFFPQPNVIFFAAMIGSALFVLQTFFILTDKNKVEQELSGTEL
jgi:hypothetical protein